ncbi:TPA: hypothetical protein ACT9JI_000403 [Legionella pneumophila]|nr:hypothetical protein [Legionella pneumophila subsp. pneumophila]HAU0936005.1 hypothetical protein [Legionella pneumophila]HCW6767910.1 hypothetical protein [Legionella pneumophila]
MKIVRIFLSFLLLFFNGLGFARSELPQLFLFLGGDKASSFQETLQNPCIRGVQIIYSWRQLEPQKGVYDFSKIEEDLNDLSRIDKKLFIQIQDRSFSPDVFPVPDYIRLEKAYHGGVVQQYDFPGEGKPVTAGWVARTWDPAVRKRFQLLLKKLASKFDGKIYGINLPETSIDLDPDNLPKDFSSDEYFYSVLDNIGYLKKIFQKTWVIQYVNFFPDEWNNDHHYMRRLFAFARKHHIGLGGPDVVPYKESQMKNSYPFFHKFKGKIETAMAIQEPDYTYTNPKTGAFYRFDDFYSFSKEYLGAFILFWNTEEPFFSEQLLPKLNSVYFKCDKVNNEVNAADIT